TFAIIVKKHSTQNTPITHGNHRFVKKVLAWAADDAGTRTTARQEKIHHDTVTSILKKQKTR
ncbi:MAG: hypothetical protein FWF62_01700, partial [Candidatus Bathyarchaeota archaeon]|nr:hypothetical protein [Candidatus Termiticorpusculum sp.]